MALCPAFTELLSDRRAELNARVAMARARTPSFDVAAFTAFLETHADPLLTAILTHDKTAGEASIDAIFDAAITLTEHRWNGQGHRTQLMNRLWCDVLPQFAPTIAANAQTTIATLSNAAVKVSQEDGVRLDQWFALLASLGRKVNTVEDARHLVVISSWQAGMAHLRDVALFAAEQLPPALACAAMGAKSEKNWTALAQQYAEHTWWAPDKSNSHTVHQIGAFIGLNGSFAAPPTISVVNDMFVVSDGAQTFSLHADAYGATLRPTEVSDREHLPQKGNCTEKRLKSDKSHWVRTDDANVPIDLPGEGLCVIETSESIAVSSPLSHMIYVFPRSLPKAWA